MGRSFSLQIVEMKLCGNDDAGNAIAVEDDVFTFFAVTVVIVRKANSCRI